MNNISRYLDVIYCDDIRNEVGNKFSYIGIYTRELNIPSVPLLLPKLCIVVKVVSDINDPIESVVVRVVITKDHEETELISTGTLIMPHSTELHERDNDSTCVLTQMQFVLSPFQIDEESTLRVKATTEREELLGVALRLRVVPPPVPPTIQ
jgi:hypothetical protein